MVQTDDGIPFSRNSSAMADGTVFTRVTCEGAGSAAKASAFCTKITFPPDVKGANSSNTERSKQMEVEANTPAISLE